MITGNNYIGFTEVKGTGKAFNTTNPVTNTTTPWQFTEAGENQVNEALVLATQAFKSYQQTTPVKRAKFLNGIADEIEALGDDLIQTYCLETGLPEGRAKGERGRTMGQLRLFANLVADGSWVNATIDTADANREPLPKPDLRKMMVPLGPVVVFGASNFPLAYSTAGGDTASALAAGCPVIVKSHPMHAGTGELVAKAIIKAAKAADMPNGVFSNLNSSGIEVGQQLVGHPLTKAVGFTGSIRGGRALLDLAAGREEPIPVFAEMGSVNPVLLLPSGLKEKGAEWAKTYAGSITLGAGQFCTNPGLLLGIESEALDSFMTTLGEEIVKIEPSCMLHENIFKAYNTNKNELSRTPGVSSVATYAKETAINHASQAVVKISGADFIANPTVQEEVFGPLSLVVACCSAVEMEQVIALINGQLTGTVIAATKELENYSDLVHALGNRVGRLICNGVPTGVEVCAAMQHGGPYPASTDSRFSAVGIHAIDRWVRPLSYQNWPNRLLPMELRNENPLDILRTIDGELTRAKI